MSEMGFHTFLANAIPTDIRGILVVRRKGCHIHWSHRSWCRRYLGVGCRVLHIGPKVSGNVWKNSNNQDLSLAPPSPQWVTNSIGVSFFSFINSPPSSWKLKVESCKLKIPPSVWFDVEGNHQQPITPQISLSQSEKLKQLISQLASKLTWDAFPPWPTCVGCKLH